MLAKVRAFYLWRNSCSKKFQSREKVHILWVGLFFSSHSLRNINDVTKKALFGRNMLNCAKSTKNEFRIISLRLLNLYHKKFIFKTNFFSIYNGLHSWEFPASLVPGHYSIPGKLLPGELGLLYSKTCPSVRHLFPLKFNLSTACLWALSTFTFSNL